MTKRKRNPWERGIEQKRKPTERDELVYKISQRKFLTVKETSMYLRCTVRLVERMIDKEVIEVATEDTGTRYIKRRSLDGLLMPVRSLHKRLTFLKEIEAEIEQKITEKQSKLRGLNQESYEIQFD